jgi:hypothetical protein
METNLRKDFDSNSPISFHSKFRALLLWKNQIMKKWKNDYSSKEEEEVEGGQKKKKI